MLDQPTPLAQPEPPGPPGPPEATAAPGVAASPEATGPPGVATDLAVLADIDRELGEVDAALGRIDGGTYGRCASCGRAVDDAVLARQPLAQRCAACAAAPG